MLDKGFSFSEMSVDSDIKKSILLALKHFESAFGCDVEKVGGQIS